MSRRWKQGQQFKTREGLSFRVMSGEKSPSDLRLDVLVGGQWQPVRMELGFMLTDFFYENEEVLYPPPRFKGGDYFLRASRTAAMRGYQVAQAGLEAEQAQKRGRDQATNSVVSESARGNGDLSKAQP